MRFTLSIIARLAVLSAVLFCCTSARAQLNSDQITFPTGCTANLVYSPFSNSCVAPGSGFLPCADTSGSGTAHACATSPTFVPAANNCVIYTTATTNSGTGLTLNVNSLGAKSVDIPGISGWTATLTASIIPANKPLIACYDGTHWNVMQTGTAASGGTGTPGGTTTGANQYRDGSGNFGGDDDCLDDGSGNLLCGSYSTANGSAQGWFAYGVGSGAIATPAGLPTNFDAWAGPVTGTNQLWLDLPSTTPAAPWFMGFGTPATVSSKTHSTAQVDLASDMYHGVCPDTSASGTAQVCATALAFTPLANSCVVFSTATSNSGTGLTLNVNSLGAKSIAIPGASGWTTTLTAGIIPSGKPMMACYDGTDWDVMQTGTGTGGGGGGGNYVNLGALVTWTGCTFSSGQCVVGTATTTIDISSIPNGYNKLVLQVVAANDDGSAQADGLSLEINGDTGSNYDYRAWFSDPSSNNGTGSAAGGPSSGICGMMATAGNANMAAQTDVVIGNYAGTAFWKTMNCESETPTSSAGALRTWTVGEQWRSTAAINQITLLQTSGGTVKFVAGSTVTIYGTN